MVSAAGAGASHADVHIQDEPLDVALPVVLDTRSPGLPGGTGPVTVLISDGCAGPPWPRRERPIPTSAVPVQDRQGPGSSPFR